MTHAEAQTAPPHPPAKVLVRAGGVEYQRTGITNWYTAPLEQGLFERDRLRTLEDGRATVEMQDLSQLRMNPRSEMVVIPARTATAKCRVEVLKGLLYFLHRNRPGEMDVETPVGIAAIEGTEFVLAVDEITGASTLSLVDGRVELSNEFGKVVLVSGEQGVMERGQPPRKTAVMEARNVVQWCLYYPGVLDLKELNLDAGTQRALASSLTAYREGDLLQALSQYPAGRLPQSEAEKCLWTALQLSTGRATNHAALLAGLDAQCDAARALQMLASAVRREACTDSINTNSPSQSLAHSYWRQSQHDLDGALADARMAVKLSPDFAFAWVRVAELEFSFGRLHAAEHALDRALALSPRNAQAHALRGFLWLARGKQAQADASFGEAMAIDPMLANAWLGRGLGRIRAGRATEGRSDLQTAALIEPNRSLLRSYLGKAWAHEALFAQNPAGRLELRQLAKSELALARQFDPFDPTPWLYSALRLHDEYRTAEAIRDLEESQRLNDNRAVYRSRLLLDQDQAVRSANLANIFEDAGMSKVGVRESARAVAFDYGNYSAHLNLAGSFDLLRDLTRFNLRYESEWFNEHLLASLLAPVGAGSLSQHLSQQEYSRLFTGRQFGLNSSTEYFSDGEWRQTASQFGTLGSTSYALDLDYQHKDGGRPNNDLDRIEWYSRIKQQFGSRDTALLLVKYQDYDSGDNFQYYDPAVARRAFRFTETQTPLLLAGWHHEWSPGMHTLFLGGRLENDQHLGDTNANQLVAVVNPAGVIDPTTVVPFDVKYRSAFETYSAELNQIFQRERHTDVLGLRYQDGSFDANALLDNPPASLASLFALPQTSRANADFQRWTLYEYHHWQIVDGLMLIGGIAYDNLTYPANFRRPPLESNESQEERWSPKAGLIWDLTPRARVRGVFSRALGGVSYDESVRLEPTQLAGFGQSFRSVISESLVGSVEAPGYQVAGGAFDLRPWTNAWLSLQAENLQAAMDRDFGLFAFDFFGSPAGTPANTVERFNYEEWQARVVFNQILGRQWFLEAQYQFTRSEMERCLPTIPASPSFARTTILRADLHEARLAAIWRSPSGWFARGELRWLAQELGDDGPQPSGDSFPQANLHAGYRFPNRRAELMLGVLNLTDQDYRLSPLNYYLEMPRERLFHMRVRFNF